MKISIDTKEDSHEDIRKVITMLTAVIGNQQTPSPPSIQQDQGLEASSLPSDGGLFAMFNTNKENQDLNTASPAFINQEIMSMDQKIKSIKENDQQKEDEDIYHIETY